MVDNRLKRTLFWDLNASLHVHTAIWETQIGHMTGASFVRKSLSLFIFLFLIERTKESNIFIPQTKLLTLNRFDKPYITPYYGNLWETSYISKVHCREVCYPSEGDFGSTVDAHFDIYKAIYGCFHCFISQDQNWGRYMVWTAHDFSVL